MRIRAKVRTTESTLEDAKGGRIIETELGFQGLSAHGSDPVEPRRILWVGFDAIFKFGLVADQCGPSTISIWA